MFKSFKEFVRSDAHREKRPEPHNAKRSAQFPVRRSIMESKAHRAKTVGK